LETLGKNFCLKFNFFCLRSMCTKLKELSRSEPLYLYLSNNGLEVNAAVKESDSNYGSLELNCCILDWNHPSKALDRKTPSEEPVKSPN